MTFSENVFLISISANETKGKPIKIYYNSLKKKVNIAAKNNLGQLEKRNDKF